MVEFKCLHESSKLPIEWDDLADNYFQQTKFLQHTEKFNPCKQRYYLCFENKKLVSGAIMYSLYLDLFTFIKIKSPIKMNIVGVPCSVSSQGLIGQNESIEALKQYITNAEKGFKLFLNLKNKPATVLSASGRTLPTILLQNRFSDWNNYKSALRSNYRRRLNQINSRNPTIGFERKQNIDFTQEMYYQYLQVYKRSSGKLEKLNVDFFKNLPKEFILTACYNKDVLLGWNLALEIKETCYFFLGGINYKHNRKYNTYLRLLSFLIKNGITQKFKYIELGQTAETPKMRMGGKPIELYMEASHSNLLLNKIIKLSSSLLEYKAKLENTTVFKEGIL